MARAEVVPKASARRGRSRSTSWDWRALVAVATIARRPAATTATSRPLRPQGALGALGTLEEGDRAADLGRVDGDQLPAVVAPVVEDLLGVVGQQRDGRVLPGGHGTPIARAVGYRPGGYRSAGAAGQELPALVLVEAAPDAVGLADQEGVLAALGQHRAGAADGLGGGLARQPLLLALQVVGSEEQVGDRALAGGTVLPADLEL